MRPNTTTKKLVIIFLAGIVVGVGCLKLAGNPLFRKVVKKIIGYKSPNVAAASTAKLGSGLFSDFDGQGPVSWGGKEVSTQVVEGEECTQGKCLKVDYPAKDYPGLSATSLPDNWSGYDMLKFDVFNPQDDVVQFGILLKDKSGGDPYLKRYDGMFALRPGKSTFIFNITGLKSNDKSRNMEMDKVKELIIFLSEPKKPATLYFDNIRLEKESSIEVKGIKKYDFGPEGSEVWPGFTVVNQYTKYQTDMGYGWLVMWDLLAEDRRYPDPLLRDWVRGQGPFVVDVPKGEYIVYIMIDDPGFWEYYQNFKYRKVLAEEKVVIEEGMTPDEFFNDHYFLHLNQEDMPKEDFFQNYVQQRFHWRHFNVTVTDGQLTLQFDPGNAFANTVSAVILAPVSEEASLTAFMKDIDDKRKEYFASQYIEKINEPQPLPEALRTQFSDAEFVPFQKNYMEEMYPMDAPREDQLSAEIMVSAATGEREPRVLGLYGLKDAGPYRMKVSDLTSSQNQVITADHVKVRKVQYRHKLIDNNRVYQVKGELLRDDPQVDIKAGVARYMWLTFEIPAQTPPGEYHGRVELCPVEATVEQSCSTPQGFEITLNVLPFRLVEADMPIGLFYGIPYQFDWYDEMKDQKWTATEFQLNDMREHGMNTIALGYGPNITNIKEDGTVELDLSYFIEFLKAYRHFGFTQPISGYGLNGIFHNIREKTKDNKKLFEQAILSAYSQIRDHAKLITGQDIVIGIADEVSNPGSAGIDSLKDVAKILKDNGFNATGFLNDEGDVEIFPYLKTVTINEGVGLTEEVFQKAQKAGSDVWIYNSGQDRFSFGFYPWRVKAKGRVEWHYMLPSVDPFNDLDGRESDFCASYPTLKKPINTPWFERIAEGVDDYRYIRTLEQMIEHAQLKGVVKTDPAIISAQALLSSLQEEIPYALRENKWTLAKYDEVRAKLSAAIISLNQKIGEAVTP